MSDTTAMSATSASSSLCTMSGSVSTSAAVQENDESENLYKVMISAICLFHGTPLLAKSIPNPLSSGSNQTRDSQKLFGQVRRAVINHGDNVMVLYPNAQGDLVSTDTLGEMVIAGFGNAAFESDDGDFARCSWIAVTRLSKLQTIAFGGWSLAQFLVPSDDGESLVVPVPAVEDVLLQTVLGEISVASAVSATDFAADTALLSDTDAHSNLSDEPSFFPTSVADADTVVLKFSPEPTTSLDYDQATAAAHYEHNHLHSHATQAPTLYITTPPPDQQDAARVHMGTMVDRWNAFATCPHLEPARLVHRAMQLYLRILLHDLHHYHAPYLVATTCMYVAIWQRGHVVQMSDFGLAIGIPAVHFYWAYAAVRDAYRTEAFFAGGLDVSLSVLPVASSIPFQHNPSHLVSDAVALGSHLLAFLVSTSDSSDRAAIHFATRDLASLANSPHRARAGLSMVDGVACLLVAARAHGCQWLQVVHAVGNGDDLADGSFGEHIAHALVHLARSPMGTLSLDAILACRDWEQVCAESKRALHPQQQASAGGLVGWVRGWMRQEAAEEERFANMNRVPTVHVLVCEMVGEWNELKGRVPLRWDSQEDAERARAPVPLE